MSETLLNVSNIQHFSTGDGPGIRSTVFLKGCNLRCPWCHNPETRSPEPQTLVFEKAGKRVSYGRMMSAAEIVAELEEDAEFYLESGGGVTVSGGEPMLQPEGVLKLVLLLNGKNIPTVIDTAGNVPWSSFLKVLEGGYVDKFFFDVKSGDREQFATVTGGDLDLVSDNLKRLVAAGQSVRARVPLIPRVNIDRGSLEKICRLCLEAGITELDVLPFHRLGSAKYEALGIRYPFKDVKPPEKEETASAAAFFAEHFKVTVE